MFQPQSALLPFRERVKTNTEKKEFLFSHFSDIWAHFFSHTYLTIWFMSACNCRDMCSTICRSEADDIDSWATDNSYNYKIFWLFFKYSLFNSFRLTCVFQQDVKSWVEIYIQHILLLPIMRRHFFKLSRDSEATAIKSSRIVSSVVHSQCVILSERVNCIVCIVVHIIIPDLTPPRIYVYFYRCVVFYATIYCSRIDCM